MTISRYLGAKIQNNIEIIHIKAHFYTLFNKTRNYAGSDCRNLRFMHSLRAKLCKKSTFSGIESMFLGIETTFSV
jgi:hypothetical protein